VARPAVTYTDIASTALGFAEEDFPYAQGLFSEAATALSGGESGEAVTLDLLGSDYSAIIPIQELLLGATASP
jgi:hypothetical protein